MRVLVVCLFGGVVGCSGSSSIASTSASTSAFVANEAPVPTASAEPPSVGIGSAPADEGPVANDPTQHAVLKAIAENVTGFVRADGTWWGPLDCRAPPDDVARVSGAASGTAHGRKIYTLQILDFERYARETGGRAQAEGASRVRMAPAVPGASQALVKVSYEPTEDETRRVHGVAPVSRDGRTWFPGARKELFVMYRPADAKVATDEGWLYGTVSPDGTTVTSAGKVKSCMGCHAKAPYGRQFGVQ